jgi:hypothetical protein
MNRQKSKKLLALLYRKCPAAKRKDVDEED